ncbi:MAG TPA: DUF4139 domain-containing protein [Kofleriaceae bacterium]|nr:DUF4139 domain-containing protein [Kofleriaceae bacterium]
MTAQGVASRIDAVTVYRRGARVTRVAEIAAEGDGFPRAIKLGGLPLGLDDGSVRARIEPVPGAERAGDGLPAAVDLRVVLDVPDPDPSLRPADDAELEGARMEERQLEREVGHIEHQLGQLERLGLVPRPRGKTGSAPPPSPTAARLSLIHFKSERGRVLSDKLRETREQLDAATRRRERLEDLARRATSARQAHEHELRKAVLVSLRAGRGAEGGARACLLHLDYEVPGARWAPAYSLRLDESMTGASLALRAIVAQDTGEDWRQVALILSTAESQAWTELPELASIRIGRRQPPPQRVGWRPPPTGVDDLYRDWDRVFGGRVPRPTPSVYGAFDDLADEPTRVGIVPPADPNAITGIMPPSVTAQLGARGRGDDFDEDTAVRGPLPPPMTLAASPGQAAPAARGRRITGAVAAVAGAPAALARSLARSESRRPSSGPPPMPAGGAGGAGMDSEMTTPMARPAPPEQAQTPVPSLEVEASAAMLRYHDLRMSPPSSRRRGRLVLAGQVELYLSLLIEQRVEVRFDVLSAVDGARQRAQSVSLPPGCVLAWAEGYDYAYRAESRVDVPSDGDSHSLPLAVRRATSEPLYVVVPRESTEVFRTATVENPLGSPLLPGPVDVYLDGDFLLTSRVELTPPRGKLSVGLGVEQGIKVARNTRYREESAGLMGGALLLRHQIHIDVRSNLGRPAPLEVRERIPVSREDDDDVQVAEHSVRPQWEEWQQEPARPSEPLLRGGYRWKLTLAAGAREELRADYDIRIPAKQELVGGNRREE